MARFFHSQTRVTLLAVLLAVAAWGRLAVMGFVNPSPFREMRVEAPFHKTGDAVFCSGPIIATSGAIYRLGCGFTFENSPYNSIMRFDMVRGVLDNAWQVDGAEGSTQDNRVVAFKVDADGSAEIGFVPDPSKASAAIYTRLVPGAEAETIEPPASLPDPPAPVGPQTDPASSARLSAAALGPNWVIFPEIHYRVDDSGHLSAVKLWTGRSTRGDNQTDPPAGLLTFNQIGLGDRWVLVERVRGALAGRAGYDAVLDDASGSAGGVVPIDGRVLGGSDWQLAAADPAGGLWLFENEMTYAHFDSALRRSDPLNVFERLERMQADHYRDFSGVNWWYADSRFWLEASGNTARQLSTFVLLLGLPILALMAWLVWRPDRGAGPFGESIALRRAAQVYIGLFVVFVYWYWMVTAVF